MVSTFETDGSLLLARLEIDIPTDLLELALTHRSYSYEHGAIPTNERLEFLGDSILGQAVTVMLYTRFPDLEEGDLAKRRASLVSTVALAEIARGIGLGSFVRLGRGEELTGGRDKASILADTMEAIIGASYLGAGPDAATALVLRLVAPLATAPGHFGISMDPKTSLQELAGHQGLSAPVYELTESGPDHQKVFVATVFVRRPKTDAVVVTATGEGPSKKQAEASAARQAFAALSAAPQAGPAASGPASS
ncbi:ribonuclease III [Agreia sp. COWG]|uniref:ribonuclease III n=1 Tax=Agreia sp. COWG TaxID=2773266 RepID=UPI00192634A5|nr:ribonuclease III [Agreia sp. COWG]CAD5994806.1 Ribonuclease 3 [Agreia sp. COWG]